ncbi:MAG: 3-dehydroquinate synthase, partial [Pseudomonadota bacterium]|nr:3-dehydroquinate synthase [Pseudomonadota bacterium]
MKSVAETETFPQPALVPRGKIVTVDLGRGTAARPHDIVIGDNILSEAGNLIAVRLGKRRCQIVTDENVGNLYLPRLEAVLGVAGHTLLPSIKITPGESSKDYATLQSVLDQMMLNAIDRNTLVVAFGGGVVGDLAGLAASLALRGLDYVQIPSTLLAQVDSSVGGKTGINTSYGKNTVGAFYQPKLVLVDVALLDSLPKRQVLAGYAEVVKYGLIRDQPFFRWCEMHGGHQVLNGDREAQIHAIGVSCAHKAGIIARDERESGERALLNLGHTFGHALEAISGYSSTLLHGEAVSIGMVMAFRLSAELGLCPAAEADRVRDHLAVLGLPVTPAPFANNIEQLMSLMLQDKKVQGGRLSLILTHGIG